MCYNEVIKLDKPPRQKIFYKVVKEYIYGGLASMYTNTSLATGVPLIAKNVKCDFFVSDHVYGHNFKGYGVFATQKQAESYLDKTRRKNCIIIRVRCKDNPRRASPRYVFPAPVCYIFNTITILDDGRPVG